MESPNNAQEIRLQDEIALLQAMYPEQVVWNDRAREVRFICYDRDEADMNNKLGASPSLLVLRLPDNYLTGNGDLPIVIQAQNASKQDLRQEMVQQYHVAGLVPGLEVLDQMLMEFEQFLKKTAPLNEPDDTKHNGHGNDKETTAGQYGQDVVCCKTVIIWLHHLLALEKRKLALNPATNSHYKTSEPRISGVTKPGYPGIMVFSGPRDLVELHVADLKNQRWQAFQVRFEKSHNDETSWLFTHGSGIKEVESMSEVVSAIKGVHNQELFLQAAGVK